jgi:hypothetical protein
MAQIKKPSELKIDVASRSLIYGQPGIGKTTLALSTPAPLLFDFDRGVHRVNPLHLKDTIQVSKWEEVIDALDNEDLTPYKTIVIDTAGKMIDFMNDFLTARDPRLKMSDGSLSLKGYGARKTMFKDFFHKISMLGKNILFVAHESEEKDGDSRYIRPEIGGSSGKDLMKELDLVGYMQAVGRKRTISFDATEKYYGKNTCNLPAQIEIPETTTAKNIFMAGILDTYGAMINDKMVMMRAYTSLLDAWRPKIEAVTNAEQANSLVAEVQEVEHVWDSKLQLALELKKKADALHLTFEPTSRKYQDPPAEEKSSKKGKAKKATQPEEPVEETSPVDEVVDIARDETEGLF